METNRTAVYIIGVILFLAFGGTLLHSADQTTIKKTGNSIFQSIDATQNEKSEIKKDLYKVVSVIDGDTIEINYNNANTRVRLIGVNTPEVADSRTVVECFGVEASNYLKNKLTGKYVAVESDYTQTDKDKYGRLLRYVYLDNEDISLNIILNGYGYEYTYKIPYKKQSEYKNAQKEAEKNKKGLWADGVCDSSSTKESKTQSNKNITTINAIPTTAKSTKTTTQQQTKQEKQQNCNIKGNISKNGQKIYHMPGQQYYNETVINTSHGERWFCTENDAVQAGWRKSKV